MSLKAFHVLFCVTSIVLCLGFGAYEINLRLQGGGLIDLTLGVLSLAGGVLLIVYFKAMLRKLKDISYL